MRVLYIWLNLEIYGKKIMKNIKKVKLEHILRLSEWKKSGSKIWSRWVPHHLYPYEKIKLEKAFKNNFLEINSKDRVNLQNIWEKICLSQNWKNYILIKDFWTDSWELFYNFKKLRKWKYDELQTFVKNII